MQLVGSRYKYWILMHATWNALQWATRFGSIYMVVVAQILYLIVSEFNVMQILKPRNQNNKNIIKTEWQIIFQYIWTNIFRWKLAFQFSLVTLYLIWHKTVLYWHMAKGNVYYTRFLFPHVWGWPVVIRYLFGYQIQCWCEAYFDVITCCSRVFRV